MALRRRARRRPPPSPEPEFILIDEGMRRLNWAGIITYGPWPHGTDRQEWVHVLPSHWDGHEVLDVLQVYDPVERPRLMRRGEIDAYIRAHALPAPPEAMVPPGYEGRTELNEAMGRVRTIGGDFLVEHDEGLEQLIVGFSRLGRSGFVEAVDVARLSVERSTVGSASVDTEKLEAALAETAQQMATSAYE